MKNREQIEAINNYVDELLKNGKTHTKLTDKSLSDIANILFAESRTAFDRKSNDRNWLKIKSQLEHEKRTIFGSAMLALKGLGVSAMSFKPKSAVAKGLAMITAVLISTSGLSHISAQSIPGQTLYPVKKAFEDVTLAVRTSPESRINTHLGRAKNRLEEARVLKKNGQRAKVNILLIEIYKEINHVRSLLKDVPGSFKKKTNSNIKLFGKKVMIFKNSLYKNNPTKTKISSSKRSSFINKGAALKKKYQKEVDVSSKITEKKGVEEAETNLAEEKENIEKQEQVDEEERVERKVGDGEAEYAEDSGEEISEVEKSESVINVDAAESHDDS
ncbi:hypothetical protein LCGC14_0533690 [marine sediment metagenome]|uniref:DUF5667 domain-containing protein n=1 Tax=marine sediment metagenome TaxID=412755 RepID=A0A0F9UG81_9ZZZZ